MKYVHAAVSMNPSTGVAIQMADEARAATRLGLDWKVWLSQASELGPRVMRWPVQLRYALLRVRFYLGLFQLARQGYRIVIRHSPGDPFLFVASFFLGEYFTVHHTMEERELEASDFPYSRLQATLERLLGRRVVGRASGIVCVTPEIARYQLDRIPARPDRPVIIYPNGILYTDRPEDPPDARGERPEIIFVASTFFYWHGVEALLESMSRSAEEGTLHLVGLLSESIQRRASKDPRVQIHGRLDTSSLKPILARSWLGLSSLDMCRMKMTQACTLKVREYLRAGLPVYAGHRDSALPADFGYFRQGPAQWSDILAYARAMREVRRETVSLAARPYIDKKLLLAELHLSLDHACASKIDAR